jgi:hypothetical protein
MLIPLLLVWWGNSETSRRNARNRWSDVVQERINNTSSRGPARSHAWRKSKEEEAGA